MFMAIAAQANNRPQTLQQRWVWVTVGKVGGEGWVEVDPFDGQSDRTCKGARVAVPGAWDC